MRAGLENSAKTRGMSLGKNLPEILRDPRRERSMEFALVQKGKFWEVKVFSPLT